MSNLIRVDRAFILFANCHVQYIGRAQSTLEQGNYLIIRKGDGTLLIHGGSMMPPINYQGSGAIMTRVDDCLISTKGDETIKIFISEVLQYQEMTNWSDHKKVIRRTERDLVNKITSSLDELLQIKIIERFNEFKTPVGPVDVVGIDINGLYHIIEVKRGKATIGGCSQILRYSDYFNTINVEHKAYIMCPKITTGVGRFIASNHRLSWKEVDY